MSERNSAKSRRTRTLHARCLRPSALVSCGGVDLAAEPAGSSGTGRWKSCSRRIRRDKLNNCAVVRGAAAAGPPHWPHIQSHLLIQHGVSTVTRQLPALRPSAHQQTWTGSLQSWRQCSSCTTAMIILAGSLWRGLRPSGRGFLLSLKATRGWVLSSGITQLKFGQTALRWAAADQAGSSCSSASASAVMQLQTACPLAHSLSSCLCVLTCCWCFARFTHDHWLPCFGLCYCDDDAKRAVVVVLGEAPGLFVEGASQI